MIGKTQVLLLKKDLVYWLSKLSDKLLMKVQARLEEKWIGRVDLFQAA